MTEWKWIHISVVRAIHAKQLARYGGLEGERDSGALESALARQQSLDAYGCVDIAEIASAYVFGMCKNHPFVDGNKRTGYTTAKTFIGLHGYRPHIETMDIYNTVSGVAEGSVSEAQLAQWFRDHIERG